MLNFSFCVGFLDFFYPEVFSFHGILEILDPGTFTCHGSLWILDPQSWNAFLRYNLTHIQNSTTGPGPPRGPPEC